jgi:hypothetical protein
MFWRPLDKGTRDTPFELQFGFDREKLGHLQPFRRVFLSASIWIEQSDLARTSHEDRKMPSYLGHSIILSLQGFSK